MSTILKALKKAEEGMARNTLPGKILAADSVAAPAGGRARVLTGTTILVSALVLIAGLVYYLQSREQRAGRMESYSPRPAAAPTAARPARGEGEQEEAALPPLRLSGVLWDKTEPLAILNGRPLTVGGEIAGARVVKIGLDGVQIHYRGREYTIAVE